jgi:F0F1-type ATP synthase assembly protein I
MKYSERMKFSNRLLMVITPLGVAIGLYEAWHLAGNLFFLMALQISGLAAGAFVVVRIVRKESGQKRADS